MAAPTRDAIGRAIAMTFGLVGGGAVGFWWQVGSPRGAGCLQAASRTCASVLLACHALRRLVQKKLIEEERAARAIRLKARMERLKVQCIYSEQASRRLSC